MGFESGTTYRLTNKYYPGHALNVYGTNTASTGRNVCLYADTPSDIMQKWIVRKTSGNYFRMHSAVIGKDNFVLDCSDGSLSNSYKNNAHLCATSQTSLTDSQVEFDRVSDNVYRIYLPGKNLYLTATNTTLVNGLPASSISTATALTGGTGGQSNVYWAAYSSSTKQQWTVSPNVDGGGTPTEVVVTNMPDLPQYYGTSLTEYFHPTSGMVPGTFNGANNGQALLNKIKTFYEDVFGYPPNELKNYAYSLFGSKTITSNATFNNTYHLGVDINRYHGAPVKFAHQGELIRKSGNTVAVYDAGRNITYFYLHTDIDSSLPALGQTVYPDDLVGTQSYVGLSSVSESHLHFEVRSGRVTSAGMPNRDLDTPLSALSPYQYM